MAARPVTTRARIEPAERRRRGAAGEERAARLLSDAGLQLLYRNYRCRLGELDLVARDGATLVVAEVRWRSTERFGGAAASITWSKRRRIVAATRHLLTCNPRLQSLNVRFDALLIHGADEPIEWLQAAFDAY